MDTAPFYNSLEIVMNYLRQRGYNDSEANENACRHIARLCVEGERRPLVLANLAIAAIEQEIKMEEERQTVVIADFVRHHG